MIRRKRKTVTFDKNIFNRKKLFELNDVNTTLLENVDFPKIIMTPKGYIGLVVGRTRVGTQVFIYEDMLTTTLPNKQIVKVVDTEVILTIDKLRNIKHEKNYGRYADVPINKHIVKQTKRQNQTKKKKRRKRKTEINQSIKKEEHNEQKQNRRSRVQKSNRKKEKKVKHKKIAKEDKRNKSKRQKNGGNKKI